MHALTPGPGLQRHWQGPALTYAGARSHHTSFIQPAVLILNMRCTNTVCAEVMIAAARSRACMAAPAVRAMINISQTTMSSQQTAVRLVVCSHWARGEGIADRAYQASTVQGRTRCSRERPCAGFRCRHGGCAGAQAARESDYMCNNYPFLASHACIQWPTLTNLPSAGRIAEAKIKRTCICRYTIAMDIADCSPARAPHRKLLFGSGMNVLVIQHPRDADTTLRRRCRLALMTCRAVKRVLTRTSSLRDWP